ncbi:hypothetical protein [Weissella viridescens]
MITDIEFQKQKNKILND